jgi:hypothetical protein
MVRAGDRHGQLQKSLFIQGIILTLLKQGNGNDYYYCSLKL